MKDFLIKAFSDNGQPSSSRILLAISTVAVLIGFLHVCFHAGQLPDGAASAGAGALATAPYALNRATTAWGKKDNAPTEDSAAKV